MVLMFDLSTVIKLGIRHPREKKRKRGSMRSPGKNSAWYHFLPSSSHVFWIISDDVGAARRRKLWCRIWLASYCGGVHLYLPWNLCNRAYSMLDLSSVVLAQRFAATMGHDLIKTWIPREIFFEKWSGLNLWLGSRGELLHWDSQRFHQPHFSQTKSEIDLKPI